MSKHLRRGFTLIELLVVVAIIALLIAILLPSLGRAKANAIRVKCASALRQWGTVMNLYASMNDNYICNSWRVNTNPNPSGPPNMKTLSWNAAGDPTRNIIGGPYYDIWNHKYTSALRGCPGDPNLVANSITSYAMCRYNPLTPNVTSWRLNQFKFPTETWLLGDVAQASTPTFSDITYAGLSNNQPSPTPWETQMADRHRGIGNVMFLDTHVEPKTWSDYVNNIVSKSWMSGQAPSNSADLAKHWAIIDPLQ